MINACVEDTGSANSASLAKSSQLHALDRDGRATIFHESLNDV
jgi:hypothetical protein